MHVCDQSHFMVNFYHGCRVEPYSARDWEWVCMCVCVLLEDSLYRHVSGMSQAFLTLRFLIFCHIASLDQALGPRGKNNTEVKKKMVTKTKTKMGYWLSDWYDDYSIMYMYRITKNYEFMTEHWYVFSHPVWSKTCGKHKQHWTVTFALAKPRDHFSHNLFQLVTFVPGY